MKKNYIVPSIKCLYNECEPFLAASGEYEEEIVYDPNNPATETDVTAKEHTMWGNTWDLDNE